MNHKFYLRGKYISFGDIYYVFWLNLGDHSWVDYEVFFKTYEDAISQLNNTQKAKSYHENLIVGIDIVEEWENNIKIHPMSPTRSEPYMYIEDGINLMMEKIR